MNAPFPRQDACHLNTEAADLLHHLQGTDIIVQELRNRSNVFVQRFVDVLESGIPEERVQASAGDVSP